MHLLTFRKTNIDTVFLRYGDILYRVALAQLGNDADAQDVVQDVFLKYIKAKPIFNDDNHEKAWFLRTTINHCHDLTRRNKLRIFSPLDDAINVAEESSQDLRELLSLIDQLPSKYKDTVILHSLEGFSVEETAKILDISISATKMRLSRARELLQILRQEDNDV